MINPERRCCKCIEKHGKKDDLRFYGETVTKGKPATFRCCSCGRKAFWNSGKRVPSMISWIKDKIK
jgi:hypothetical protein